jgi:cell division protein ZapA (FtsZ GTPase activity inhibitor)
VPDPVTFSILNQSYTVVPAGDPQDLLDAANELDDLMRRIAKSRNVDHQRAAVFAALHMMQKMRSQQRTLDEMRSTLESRSSELASLLDSILDGPV